MTAVLCSVVESNYAYLIGSTCYTLRSYEDRGVTVAVHDNSVIYDTTFMPKQILKH